MTRLTWSENSERIFETGLDRGVLYPKDGPAVSWNGLISVDETGADSASEFFMDGRPFLYLPAPKEYKASLKAYTYPDEFSTLMGVTEVTDGMYVDSQMSDSFDLSYRTLIGDVVQGTSAGYKIHLVYNATVNPQGSSYQSLSDTVNPTDFSFDIQAVPVALAGYLPTAHVIIDTRHMDVTRLQELEDTLYGNSITNASVPEPQIIADLLGFGAEIIITNIGDGTWTAEGSYHNVYLLEPGIFEIDNVNAIGHGDGTYDISSTP